MFGLSIYKLESAPPLWWDEGWTLNVARNWVELGHYGQLLNGEPRSTGLSAAFPVVAPIALSFKLFGVGIWQGRLPGVFFTLGALALIYYLANRLYNRPIALGTLGSLMFMMGHDDLQPILIGRQVLGEMPAVFYLLAGYALFVATLRGSAWLLLPTTILWGVALRTKAQVLPFWLASLMLPLVIVLLKRWWRQAIFLIGGLIGGWAMSWCLGWLQGMVLAGRMLPGEPIYDLYSVTAIVLNGRVRKLAFMFAFTLGLPTFAGICYAACRLLQRLRGPKLDIDIEVIRMVLLSLSASWFSWYVALAMYYPRYLFPAMFIGSVFVSALLYDLTHHFNALSTIKSSGMIFRKLDRQTFGSLVAIILIAITIPMTSLALFKSYTTLVDSSLIELVDYFNNQTSSNALIETYEPELFFLLHRRYHYPPDQIHIQLISGADSNAASFAIYDPLVADPDYLVIGPAANSWGLYDQVLAAEQFDMVYTLSEYTVYQRVRH